MALEAEATRLYALLPRDRRSDLYNAVMANPMFPFHDGPDDSHTGRYFLIATGNYRAPVANDPLNIIINGLALNEGYTDAQKDIIYSCLLYTSPSPRDRTRSRMPSSA